VILSQFKKSCRRYTIMIQAFLKKFYRLLFVSKFFMCKSLKLINMVWCWIKHF